MAFHVRDHETDTLVREFARRKGIGLTEAIKLAVSDALKAEGRSVPLPQRFRAIAQRVAEYPDSKVELDKTFFDDLSGQ